MMIFPNSSESICKSFRPLTGISLFLFRAWMHHTSEHKFSSPHGDFSFSINEYEALKALADIVFVPSRGFLFFYRYSICVFESVRNNTFSSPHGDFSFSIYHKKVFDNHTILFSSPHGDFSFSIVRSDVYAASISFSSPHGDFSFSIVAEHIKYSDVPTFSSPHGDFSFSIINRDYKWSDPRGVFVPSRGFLFFYDPELCNNGGKYVFSSPHGDFSFSMLPRIVVISSNQRVFVPSRGFLFFYGGFVNKRYFDIVFVPSRGFLFFYWSKNSAGWLDTYFVFVPSRGFLFFYGNQFMPGWSGTKFSSPHGDFSFSIFSVWLTVVGHIRSFRPLTGISLFLSYLIFPL